MTPSYPLGFCIIQKERGSPPVSWVSSRIKESDLMDSVDELSVVAPAEAKPFAKSRVQWAREPIVPPENLIGLPNLELINPGG